MRSPLPKVLHEIGGQPLVFHVLDRIQEALPGAPVALVVGHQKERVEQVIRGSGRWPQLTIEFVTQTEQRGTGHALQCVMESAWGKQAQEKGLALLVLPGDTPLISSELVQGLAAPLGKGEVLRLLTTDLSNPTGYGRVVRAGKGGSIKAIVEEKDTNTAQRKIQEVAVSSYLFESRFLNAHLKKLRPNNAQGELYLTDLVSMGAKAKKKMGILKWAASEDVLGVNDLWQLADADTVLNERILHRWSVQGVRFIDPYSSRVEVDVILAEEVVVHPGVQLAGKTRIERGVTIGPRVILADVEVGEGANINAGTVATSSKIGASAQVGPYAHLRPESVVGQKAKIGNFVELKKASIGEGTSVAHLSYVGDAEIGKRVNIGCGFVTCNFDGRVIDGQRKHRTIIEDDVFLGSDCQTVAPIRIGRGAYIASGSTITEDVEPDAMAIARSRQMNKPGYAKRLRDLEGKL